MKRHPKVEAFYNSKRWQDCRKAYRQSVGNLCEVCLAKGIYTPGEIVHHKVHINPDLVEDPNVTLSFDNLELVCRKCHADEHPELYGHDLRRYTVDAQGRVIATAPDQAI